MAVGGNNGHPGTKKILRLRVRNTERSKAQRADLTRIETGKAVCTMCVEECTNQKLGLSVRPNLSLEMDVLAFRKTVWITFVFKEAQTPGRDILGGVDTELQYP